MLNGGHPILRASTIDLFTRRESAPEGSSRALGWDTPSMPSQSGKYFSARSFGHLGYTGTSLWIDRERQLSINSADESHRGRLSQSGDQTGAPGAARRGG